MNLDNQTRTSLAVVLIALLVTTGTLFVLGGFPGLLFGLGATLVWLLAPPVFAFAVGQAGVAAVVSIPYPPLIVVAELALLTILIGDNQLPATLRTWTLPVLGSTIVAVGVWTVSSYSLTAAAGFTLAGLAVLTYALHRYELLITDQLTEASS